jgi:hypothetical protein
MMKKQAILVPLLLMFVMNMFAQQHLETAPMPPDSLAIVEGDTTEYELMIFDNAFQSWFLTNSKPVWYHEASYYRSQNIQYVANWNSRVRQSNHRPPYEYEIDYDPKIDYGVELDWQLFWYFKYLEHSLGIRLK